MCFNLHTRPHCVCKGLNGLAFNFVIAYLMFGCLWYRIVKKFLLRWGPFIRRYLKAFFGPNYNSRSRIHPNIWMRNAIHWCNNYGNSLKEINWRYRFCNVVIISVSFLAPSILPWHIHAGKPLSPQGCYYRLITELNKMIRKFYILIWSFYTFTICTYDKTFDRVHNANSIAAKSATLNVCPFQ